MINYLLLDDVVYNNSMNWRHWRSLEKLHWVVQQFQLSPEDKIEMTKIS